MKKIYSLLPLLLFSVLAIAQSPQSFNYQAIVRDVSGNALVDQAVGVQISILQGSAGGTAVYVERFTPTTNDYGLINIQVGAGAVQSGTFNTIDWANGPYFLKTEIDDTGGTTYTKMGTNKLISVPYALYAETADNLEIDGQTEGDLLYYISNEWKSLPKGIPGQVLAIDPSGEPSWINLLSAPVPVAKSYEVISGQGLKLSGEVDPGRIPTTAHFELSTDESFADVVSTTDTIICGCGNISISSVLEPVPSNGTWYFRLVATNQYGNVNSNILEVVINE
ncbi:MAG: hypothetical protein K9J25_08350 [Bacteroidales bacterium]|nr:hypothetical protein [Bacteroidales bacterium]